MAFREGKRELIESIRNLITGFKSQVRSNNAIVNLRTLFSKNYNLTPTAGLTDHSLIRGSLIWPQQKDFAQVPSS